ncbi:tetratricopeptide repeat protein [Planktosalinus lacus]|uniref:Tetratricopeptide repeat protein n=1 Tax=Planktosalinus lacus TaxID=1526573 RepID=A0A8J2YA90_9FLAO|nr:tetratricopeptide repeat protein [Planktosalinus lacus]GGD90566.1 hypothetical protein GCM10011312_13100 [Planktosalinus lacus]
MKRLWFYLLFISLVSQAQEHKNLADSYFSLGNYSKAIQHLKQTPESKEQQHKLAKSYEQTGNLKSALAHYEKLFDRYPEDIFLAYEYSKLLRKTAKNKQAEEILNTLIATDSLNPNFPYQMGLLKEQQSDSLAIEYFEKAYRLDPNHLPAAVKVVTDKIKNKVFEQADTILTQTLKIDDTHFQLSNLKALNHFYQKDFHKAIAGYNKLLELNRPSENVYLKLGFAYAQVLDFEKSIEHYTIAINDYNDKNPEAHYEIATSFMALHYYEKAQRHLEIAMLLKEPQLEQEYTSLFELYHRQKKYKTALEILNEASKKYPGNEFFRYRIATTSDNFFNNKKTILKQYEIYLKAFGESGKYRLLAAQRMADIKKEIHMDSE